MMRLACRSPVLSRRSSAAPSSSASGRSVLDQQFGEHAPDRVAHRGPVEARHVDDHDPVEQRPGQPGEVVGRHEDDGSLGVHRQPDVAVGEVSRRRGLKQGEQGVQGTDAVVVGRHLVDLVDEQAGRRGSAVQQGARDLAGPRTAISDIVADERTLVLRGSAVDHHQRGLQNLGDPPRDPTLAGAGRPHGQDRRHAQRRLRVPGQQGRAFDDVDQRPGVGRLGPKRLQARHHGGVGHDVATEQAAFGFGVAAQEGESLLVLAAGRLEPVAAERRGPDCATQDLGVDQHDPGHGGAAACVAHASGDLGRKEIVFHSAKHVVKRRHRRGRGLCAHRRGDRVSRPLIRFHHRHRCLHWGPPSSPFARPPPAPCCARAVPPPTGPAGPPAEESGGGDWPQMRRRLHRRRPGSESVPTGRRADASTTRDDGWPTSSTRPPQHRLTSVHGPGRSQPCSAGASTRCSGPGFGLFAPDDGVDHDQHVDRVDIPEPRVDRPHDRLASGRHRAPVHHQG